MSDFRSWRPVYRAMCPEPGPRDLFLVILINGKRVAIHQADEHDRWQQAAERLAREQECHVKVLPMTGSELMNFLGIEPGPPQPMDALDPAFRAVAVQNCLDLLRETKEPRECEEAIDLLRKLGALNG